MNQAAQDPRVAYPAPDYEDNEIDLADLIGLLFDSRRLILAVTATVLLAGLAYILIATPMFVVLLVVESSDVVFAIDSIPAVFGITQDPFIVYTSNIFAILGLRALYFLLAGVVGKFHYLKLGLSIVLGFIGAKMLVESLSGYIMDHPIHVPITWSLGFICVVLVVSVVASLWVGDRHLETDEAVAG